jgi:hypothetical protein
VAGSSHSGDCDTGVVDVHGHQLFLPADPDTDGIRIENVRGPVGDRIGGEFGGQDFGDFWDVFCRIPVGGHVAYESAGGCHVLRRAWYPLFSQHEKVGVHRVALFGQCHARFEARSFQSRFAWSQAHEGESTVDVATH